MNVTCPECRSVFRVDPSKLPASLVRARCAVCGGLITITPSSSVRDEFAPRASELRAPSQTAAAARAGGFPPASAASPFAPPAAAATAAQPAPLQQAPPPPAFSPGAAPRPAPFVTGAPAASAPIAPPPPPPATRAEPAPTAGASRPPSPDAGAPNLGATTAAALFGRVDAHPASTGAPTRPLGGAVPPRAPSPARPAMPFVRPSPSGATPAAPPSGLTPFGVRATPPGGQGAPRRPINPFLANDPNAKARRLARALISDMITYFPEKREEGLRTGALKQLFEEEITKSYGEYVEQVGREFAESTPFFQDALNEILAGGRKLF